MTRGEETKKLASATTRRYSLRAGRILEAYCHEKQVNLHDDLDGLKRYIEETLSNRYSPATIRQYRAALNYAFANNGINIAIGDIPPGVSVRSNGGQKKKTFPLDDSRRMLRTAFGARFSGLAEMAVTMAHCSRFFGLRPSEWFCATYEHGTGTLIVRNAKTTRGRGFGKTRTLHLTDEVPSEVVEAVQWLLARISENGHSYEKPGDVPDALMKKLSATMSRVYDRTFPKGSTQPRYTLYSGRHQFAADAKAAGFSKIEIAAMMGHASPETAGEHYGRRSSGGRGGFFVMPDEADIQAVERIVFAKRSMTPSFVL